VLGSLVLVLLARIALITPPLAQRFGYGDDRKFQAIRQVAGDAPVVFASSFQTPSLYTYYTGIPSVTVSSIYNRRTQFDIWQFEHQLEGKRVFVCTQVKGRSRRYNLNGSTFEGFLTNNFHSASRLNIKLETKPEIVVRQGDTIRSRFTLYNPYSYSVDFKDDTFPVDICACFFTKKIKEVRPVVCDRDITVVKPKESISGTVQLVVPKDIKPGIYHFCFTVNTVFGPSLENELYKIRIAE
jgi:hypothetical protein